MSKIEIEFEDNFVTGLPTAKTLGRLYLGGVPCRLFFDPRGYMTLLAPEEARDKGIIFYEEGGVDLANFGEVK